MAFLIITLVMSAGTAQLAPPIALIPVILGSGLCFVVLALIVNVVRRDHPDPTIATAQRKRAPQSCQPLRQPPRQMDLSVFDAEWQPDMRYAIVWENPEGGMRVLEQRQHADDALHACIVGARYSRNFSSFSSDWAAGKELEGRFRILPRHLGAASALLWNIYDAMEWTKENLDANSDESFLPNRDRALMRDWDARIEAMRTPDRLPDPPDAPDTALVIPNAFDDEEGSAVLA